MSFPGDLLNSCHGSSDLLHLAGRGVVLALALDVVLRSAPLSVRGR